MRREAVESETIASIGYEAGRCELDVKFCETGAVYCCFRVSAEEHSELMAAESKGGRVFKAQGAPVQAGEAWSRIAQPRCLSRMCRQAR